MEIAPSFRLLQAADVPAAQRLREFAHWNQTGQDWLNLLAMEPQGCFAAEVNGQVIGTATTTRFQPASGPGSFGWVGMVLVHPEFRGQGVGSALLRKACDYLHGCGVETIKLDATPMGQPVYLKLGFRAECSLERWAGTVEQAVSLLSTSQAVSLPLPSQAGQPAPQLPAGPRIAPLTASGVASVTAYDALAFGADRGAILRRWSQCWPECAIAAWEEQRLAGYALARRGTNYHQAGPIVCEGPEAGQALLTRMFQLLAGQAVIIDILSENTWVREWVANAGLLMQRPLTRMYQGPNTAPGRRERIVAIAGPEVG